MVSVHIGQVITSIHTTLQNKEHVIEALRRADFRLPGLQKTHIFKKWAFAKFNWMNLKTRWPRSSSPRMAVGSHMPLIVALDKWPCIQENLAPSLLMPFNKPYLPAQKKS